jgi:pimeloyl-ACP methyl ester carboxylesterase
VDDAAAWVKQLRADRRFSSVAVVGHSEGSLIGIVTAKRGGVDAVVSIAGIGRPFGQVLRGQVAPQLPPDLLQEFDRVLASLSAGQMVDSVSPALAALFRPSVQPYVASVLRYDPAAEVAALGMPVLIAQGTTDFQVGVAEAEFLARAQPKAKLLIVEGMNHVLKLVPAEQGAQMRSYGDPALPVAPELVEGITTFVTARR